MNNYEGILNAIAKDMDMYACHVSPYMQKHGAQLVSAMEKETRENKELVSEYLLKWCRKDNYYMSIYLMSVINSISDDSTYLLKMEQFILSVEELSAENLFFLYQQINKLMFLSEKMNTLETKIYCWRIYQKCVSLYRNKLGMELHRIPKEERNPDLVYVITEQLLVVGHGPTKTALDRCKTLISSMKKQVVLINTAEHLTSIGEIPFYNIARGNYLPELCEEAQLTWKNVSVPYVQCGNDMPDIDVVRMLLENIKMEKPMYIICIGGSSLLAALASDMIPTISNGTVPSELFITEARYQTIARDLTPYDLSLLSEVGRSERNVIKATFTFGLKTQTEHVSRNELGIPENAFVIALVGGRLSYEVKDDFLDMLESIHNPFSYIVTLGDIPEIRAIIDKHPGLDQHIKTLGFCEDVLSRLECCDLYVNPKRKGGGTSGVEAMYVGVPVVTVNYGDVAVISGADFCVSDYSEMADTILKYQNDKEFYRIQSEKAIIRAEQLMDTDGEFVKLVDEMTKREKRYGVE